MTSTAVISSQSIGTSTNIGNSLFSINPVTLASTTTAFVVSVQHTTGTVGDIDKNQTTRVWYTTTPYTVIAANAPMSLGMTARYVDVRPRIDASSVRIVDSSLEPITGSKFHCWVDQSVLPSAGSLTVTLVELP